MGATPDRFPGPREETEIQFEEDTEVPSTAGYMKYVNGEFQFVDSTGLYDPRRVLHASEHEKSGDDIISLLQLSSSGGTEYQAIEVDDSGGFRYADAVYGLAPEFDFGTSLDEETTTSGTWIEKFSFTTKTLPLGTYLVLTQATIQGSLSSTGVGVRAQIDGSTIGSITSPTGIALGDSQFFAHKVCETFSGIHQIDIDYMKSAGGGSVTIRDCRVTLWKIGN